MKPGEAVMKLTSLGFRFEAEVERLRWRFEGQGQPDPGQVRPLLQMVKECRDEVLFFLRCYCPRCGGAMFIPDPDGRDLCARCDWHLLVDFFPGLRSASKSMHQEI
jgi:ribosomal protein S27AE